MNFRAQVMLIVGAAVAVWALMLWLTGPQPSLELLKPFGVASSAVTLLALAFTKWVWRWRVFRGWLVNRPYIGGTWRANLTSSYEKDGVPVNKTGFMVVTQDLITLNIRLYTDQAHSYSITESSVQQPGGFFEVACVYINKPNANLRAVQKSQIHHGALLLGPMGYSEKRLEGHYWTDRKTMGEIVLTDRMPASIASFKAGQELYGMDSGGS